MSLTQKVYIRPGEQRTTRCPWSEVCMHMRIAGKLMRAELLVSSYGHKSVQLYRLNGEPFSMPIGVGEAGFYEDDEGVYYYPIEVSRFAPPDADAGGEYDLGGEA